MQKQSTTLVVTGPLLSTSSPDIEQTVARIIASKARLLVERHTFRRDDYEDLIQELTLQWLRYRPFYRPHRSSLSTYATRVIDSRIAEMVRERSAAKRGLGSRPASLDALLSDGEGSWARRGELLVDDELPVPPASATERSQGDLRLDLAATVASLPEPLRILCARLKSLSITEVARLAGVPRSTVYESVKQLRRIFAAAGMKDYLPTFRGHSAQNG